MRLIPILSAVVVTVVLYFLVVDRDVITGEAASEDMVASADQGTEQAAAMTVVTKRSTAQTIDTAVRLRGQTQAVRQLNVMAETSGKVISTPLRKGVFVQKGQVLCEIDPGTRPARLAEAEARLAEIRARRPEATARIPEAEARLQQAMAQVAEARINDNAAQRLSKDGYASDARVAAAQAGIRAAEAGVKAAQTGVETARAGLLSLEANIRSAEAAVQAAQTEVNRLRVIAPFAGTLESDTAEYGSLMQPNAPSGASCATILQLDPMKLVAFVPETQITRVKIGARALGRITSSETPIEGIVTFLARSADPQTRTFRVEAEVPNPNLLLRDGQTVDIAIDAAGAKAHLLPASALTLNDQGTLGVRTVGADGIVQFIPAQLLRDTAEGVWLGGLPETTDVIVVGQEYVRAGVKVATVQAEAAQ